MTETLTFSLAGAPVTELIIEPLSLAAEAKIFMEPPVVRFLAPNSPVKCSILVEEGRGEQTTLTGLRHLLENRRSGKIQAVLRFTNTQGRRRRIPFSVEVMGSHHEVVWAPGPEEDASPDW
jgi:hypothetical protein